MQLYGLCKVPPLFMVNFKLRLPAKEVKLAIVALPYAILLDATAVHFSHSVAIHCIFFSSLSNLYNTILFF